MAHVTNTAAGTSDSAAIRVESSQGHRYSFRGNANTAHQDRTLSPGAQQGSETVLPGRAAAHSWKRHCHTVREKQTKAYPKVQKQVGRRILCQSIN